MDDTGYTCYGILEGSNLTCFFPQITLIPAHSVKAEKVKESERKWINLIESRCVPEEKLKCGGVDWSRKLER